ncbi:hypothetical protein Taro_008718, partial [Colocasia esculenta]|nr:hypothetical protein [Colocasia esculenta]
CNDPSTRTPARDPEVCAATHGSEDPKGGIPENLQSTTLNSLRYKSSQHSLSLLLTTHDATTVSANRLTQSSRDDDPLAEESRGSIAQELPEIKLFTIRPSIREYI